MDKLQTEESLNKAQSAGASLAEAVYPGKETWKSEPGNRYTPEELREMDRRWDVQIVNPDAPHFCAAD